MHFPGRVILPSKVLFCPTSLEKKNHWKKQETSKIILNQLTLLCSLALVNYSFNIK